MYIVVRTEHHFLAVFRTIIHAYCHSCHVTHWLCETDSFRPTEILFSLINTYHFPGFQTSPASTFSAAMSLAIGEPVYHVSSVFVFLTSTLSWIPSLHRQGAEGKRQESGSVCSSGGFAALRLAPLHLS